MVRKATNAGIAIDGAARDEAARDAFREEMDRDFGTPEAMAVVFELVRKANSALDSGDEAAPGLVATAVELATALGVPPEVPGAGGEQDGDAEIDAMVEARTAAKAAKDWTEADRIRDELAAQGITIEDTPTGPIWYR